MSITSRFALVLATLVAFGSGVAAQDAPPHTQYRDYALGASLASVVTTSGSRDVVAKTVHARPALLQTFEWRAPYGDPQGELVDPVHDIRFQFVDDALYRLDIRYHRDRTLGLTRADLIDAITATYGPPVAAGAARAASSIEFDRDLSVVAHWSLPTSSVTLLTAIGAPEYQLVVVSTPLNLRARTAAREAERLDLAEAPQRAIDSRKQDVRDAQQKEQTARTKNKPAFRP